MHDRLLTIAKLHKRDLIYKGSNANCIKVSMLIGLWTQLRIFQRERRPKQRCVQVVRQQSTSHILMGKKKLGKQWSCKSVVLMDHWQFQVKYICAHYSIHSIRGFSCTCPPLSNKTFATPMKGCRISRKGISITKVSKRKNKEEWHKHHSKMVITMINTEEENLFFFTSRND